VERDFRSNPHYKEATALFSGLFGAGTGHVYYPSDFDVAADGSAAFLAGQSFTGSLEGGPTTSLYRCDLERGGLQRIDGTSGARLPRAAPLDDRLAWVVANGKGAGDVVIVAAGDGGGARREIAVAGLVEQLAWSADGSRLLLLVAGLGADLAGYQGGFALDHKEDEGLPSWLPEVVTGDDEDLWRRVWLIDTASGSTAKVSNDRSNVWEVSWCGDAILATASDDPGEGSWYRSTLRLIDPRNGTERELYAPAEQIGLAAASPDGQRIAFVEAICSDRGIICGDLKLLDLPSGKVRDLATPDFDVTSLEWQPDGRILVAGQRRSTTFVAAITADGAAEPIWRSETLTCGEWYPRAHVHPHRGAVLVVEGYDRAPALAIASGGELTIIHDFARDGARADAADYGVIEDLSWSAPDGLEIQGLLVSPANASGPTPLVLDIHGGPVWSNRPRWVARTRATPMLVRRGYRVLFPNPRGSSTRGQDFVRLVKGDMGGADTYDLIAALDHLIARGLADPAKLACTGSSYGGFMSCRLVTKDQRFAAAAPISPVTNWQSQHRTSQIPFFDEIFLDGSPYDLEGPYFTHSPVLEADRVRTPTLLLSGRRDKNTPPGQALEFYTSLAERNVETVLVNYPEDGHSLRGFPAYVDSAARISAWFERFIG
jgi:dipeptidyl aminopeptidase/acylaminoacyl peptidase